MQNPKEGLKVLDSWALLVYFEGQAGGGQVKDIIQEAAKEQRSLLISVVNWGEILYIIETRYSADKRDQIEKLMELMPLEIIEVDKDIAREAARIKAVTKLSYADSFAAGVASLKQAILITGDTDFKKAERIIRIQWI